MASQFEPKGLEIIDSGICQRIPVDGLARYIDENGLIRSFFYAHQPAFAGQVDEPFREAQRSAAIVLELVYSHVAQEQMRRKLMAHLTATDHPFQVDFALAQRN